MPPLPAWLTIAQMRPCFLMVGKSAGPSNSTECSPIRFAFAARSSTDMSLKHQRQTDCLIELAAPRAGCVTADAPLTGCTAAAFDAPLEAPPDAHAADAPTAPRPAIVPPTVTLRCT